MSLEATIAENTAAIRELIARLAAAAPIPPAPPAEEQPAPKPSAKAADTPRTAAAVNKPAADALAEKDAATSAELGADGAAPDAATYDDVKRAILEISKAKGRDAALKLLAQFGAAKGPDLQATPEKFGAFVAAANAALAA